MFRLIRSINGTKQVLKDPITQQEKLFHHVEDAVPLKGKLNSVLLDGENFWDIEPIDVPTVHT
ncbi:MULTISPECIES: hypothetical protein [Pontibacillus]|uniref:Uncharacterized protein n=1 Tax=Pontibacillus chungwhensis TaxID=265426 RepID=A0ABY8V5G2_9BACI|nr:MULTISPECIES: hypothetical protein [Pontibacillus]MCD5324620.1 hypothetical protein [Pontibacillus sp. HN14]WIF99086.1 hypothetical protein QNI29_05370 [Pontibacillus chungwhensis]